MAGRRVLLEHDALRRIGELHSQAAEFVDDAKIDRLLQVEQRIDRSAAARSTTARIAGRIRRASSGGSARSAHSAARARCSPAASGMASSFSDGRARRSREWSPARAAPAARPKLRTRLFRMSAFDRMICSPLSLRRRVVLMPMRSTVPVKVSIVRLSPTTNGLSSAIDSEANRSPSTFCSASATATPPTPRPASSAVMLTPRFSSATRISSDQISMRATKLMMSSEPANTRSAPRSSSLISR